MFFLLEFSWEMFGGFQVCVETNKHSDVKKYAVDALIKHLKHFHFHQLVAKAQSMTFHIHFDLDKLQPGQTVYVCSHA